MADRYIDVSLTKRGVHCTAKLLDDRAPITCEAVWNALPLGSDVYHAKVGASDGTVVVSSTLDSVGAAASELVAAGRKPDTPLTVTIA
ncbi:DUF3830 family protein, partial [Streptomyces sp. YC419]